MLDTLAAFLSDYGRLLLEGTFETLAMLLIPTAISYAIGTALGVILYLTSPGSLRPMRTLNAVLGWIVNILRSFPFIVLMMSIIPFTRALMGTSTGIAGTIPALVLSATPFIARMIEQSLAEVPRETVEAAEACGASIWRIVRSALLPEALPSIVRGVAVVLIAVLGYTAIAGAVGAGGLGDVAIRYGYYRYQGDVMAASIVILIVIVQVIQGVCDVLTRHVDHRVAKRRAGRPRRGVFAAAALLIPVALGAGWLAASSPAGGEDRLVVAATPSPHAQILQEFAAPRLAERGIELEVREYTDYIMPNQDVIDGEVDANYFQHLNYLRDYNAKNGSDLVSAGKIHFEPMGVFPGASTDLDAISSGAKISVPNDPTNEGRALLLLQDLGLISVDPDAGVTATKRDIVSNPLSLDIIEQEAAMLPATLEDVDFSVINGNYAIEAGLSLADAVAQEDAQSPVIQREYANIICTTPEMRDDPRVKALVEVLQTDEFRQYLAEAFGDSVQAAF